MDPRNLPPLATRRQVAITDPVVMRFQKCLILGSANPGFER